MPLHSADYESPKQVILSWRLKLAVTAALALASLFVIVVGWSLPGHARAEAPLRLQQHSTNPLPASRLPAYDARWGSYQGDYVPADAPASSATNTRTHTPTRTPTNTPTNTATITPTIPACGLAWRIVPSASAGSFDNYLRGVAAVSANDIWAVGYASGFACDPVVERWDDNQWSLVPSPHPGYCTNLYGIAALSANDIWAVGYYYTSPNPAMTLIEHWNGSVWSQVPSPNPGSNGNYLYGVAALSANDIWAVGYISTSTSGQPRQTLALHWNGSQWSPEPSPNPSIYENVLYAVAALSPNDVWAVGYMINNEQQYQSRTLALHWNGSQWSLVSSPNPSIYSNAFYGMTAISTNDVWAVGFFGAGPHSTLAEHWDGNQWSALPSPAPGYYNFLYGAVATSSTDVWAVGYTAEYGRPELTLTVHWDGSQWTQAVNPVPGPQNSRFYGVASLSSHYVWAVGTFNYRTLVERYHDPCVTSTPTSTNTNTPTNTPTDTPTNTPGSCSPCNLSVTSVTISCDPGGTVHWVAVVHNGGNCTVVTDWKATLLQHIPGHGGFTGIAIQRSTPTPQSFPPGDTTVEGNFCAQFAPNANVIKAEFSVNAPDVTCQPKKKSLGIEPCPASCPPRFPDVPAYSPYFSAANFLNDDGVVSGYIDGTFRLYNNTTRGQICKIAYLAGTGH